MKIKTLILTLLIMVVITVGCIFAYNYFTSDNTDVSVNEEQKSILFTLDNYPKVDASLATQPLTDAFAAAFTGEKNIWLALLGVAALAISVNLVEIMCTTGFPTIFVSFHVNMMRLGCKSNRPTQIAFEILPLVLFFAPC